MIRKTTLGWGVVGVILATGVAGAAVMLCTITELTGNWTLNEAAGTTAADATGGSDGMWMGAPTAVANVPGALAGTHTNALQVTRPGANYVEIPNTPALENIQEDNYSLMAWFYPNSIPPSDDAMGEPNQYEGMYAILYKQGWHEGIGYNKNQEFIFEHWTLDSMNANDWEGTGTWGTAHAPGQWYHVAGVADFVAEQTRVYVNGTLMNTFDWTAGYTQGYREFNQEPWRIGSANPGNFTNYEYQADGIISDARIYSRVLTDSEIAEVAAGVDVGGANDVAPAAPTGVTATGGVGAVTVAWAASPTAWRYSVYRGTASGGPYTQIATDLTTTSYLDATTVPQTDYYYVVTACRGTEGVFSAEAAFIAPIPSNREGDEDGCSCSTVRGFSGFPIVGFAGLVAGLLLVFRRR